MIRNYYRKLLYVKNQPLILLPAYWERVQVGRVYQAERLATAGTPGVCEWSELEGERCGTTLKNVEGA
jgi:hypothetical protein